MRVFYSEIGFNPDPEHGDTPAFYLTDLDNGYVGIVNEDGEELVQLPKRVLRAMADHLDDLGADVPAVADEEVPF